MTQILHILSDHCLIIYGIIHIICALYSWAWQEGYAQHHNEVYALQADDEMLIVFDLFCGPAALIATGIIYGCGYTARRFWTPRRKKAWIVLKKLESYAE